LSIPALKDGNEVNPYAVGRFGGGARSCIGKHLALLEAKISLVKFMKRYSKIVCQTTTLK
jgi:cytochrome P450